MYKLFSYFLMMLSIASCNAQNADNFKTIPVAEYQQLLTQSKKQIQIIDVRTAEEFAEDHLQNAINIDYNANDFDTKINTLDKSKLTLIYCLSGGRSASTMKIMGKANFKEVYNMKGGILQWRAANLPLTTKAVANNNDWIGMSKEDYQQLISGKIPVVIDFNAKWCGPCKQLKPILAEIENEYKGKIKIIPIDIDENKSLARSMFVNNIPLLIYHENGKVILNQEGFLDKEGLVKLFKLK